MLIGELAKRTGTTTRALRYYEQQGLLAPDRRGNGYRHYDTSAELHVCQIRGLLNAGFSTDEIAAVLPCARDADPRLVLCPKVVDVMEKKLARIEREIASLAAQRASVTGLLGISGPTSSG